MINFVATVTKYRTVSPVSSMFSSVLNSRSTPNYLKLTNNDFKTKSLIRHLIQAFSTSGIPVEATCLYTTFKCIEFFLFKSGITAKNMGFGAVWKRLKSAACLNVNLTLANLTAGTVWFVHHRGTGDGYK